LEMIQTKVVEFQSNALNENYPCTKTLPLNSTSNGVPTGVQEEDGFRDEKHGATRLPAFAEVLPEPSIVPVKGMPKRSFLSQLLQCYCWRRRHRPEMVEPKGKKRGSGTFTPAGAVYQMYAPMKMIPLEAFEKFGRIPRSSDLVETTATHLDLGRRGRSRCVVVFISHRWLRPSLNPEEAHPDSVDGVKYQAILTAAHKLKASVKDKNQIYIWIDYFSIDQDNAALKKAGIRSLPAYVENSDILLTPYADGGSASFRASVSTRSSRNNSLQQQQENCPLKGLFANDWPEQYVSLCLEGKGEQYFERAWCRLEMFLGSNCPLPEGGFGYFEQMRELNSHRRDRPHFLSGDYQDGTLWPLPKLSHSWLEKLDPLEGHLTSDRDLEYIQKIMDEVRSGAHEEKRGYEGEMHQGRKHGSGSYYYDDGSSYQGEWKDDLQSGRGTFFYADGGRYEGEWQDGKRCGHGIKFFADGGRYEGEWKNDVACGKGAIYFSDGSRYEGEFKNDSRCGFGTMYYTDKSRYEGGWKKGVKHGQGIVFLPDGEREQQHWHNGKKSRTIIRDFSRRMKII